MGTLKIDRVTVRHKEKVSIKNVSFEAEKGEIIGFIGADGAGKSSLMHAIAGVIAFEGEVRFDQHAYRSPKEAEGVKSLISLMPQGIGLVLYDLLTVDEHLRFFADIRNVPQDEAYHTYKTRLLKMAGLEKFREFRAGNLSGGMMQKLSLICSLLHRPKLLILDEPTTGVDPMSRIELWEILDQIRREEGTIALVSTAYMEEAARMDRVLLFDEGEIIAQGSAKELIESVREMTYLRTPEAPEGTITTLERSYSLLPLSAEHAEPTLESLFFVNALRTNRAPPPVEITRRDSEENGNPVLMEAYSLTKMFGPFVANDRIDLQLKRGEIVGLLGANGAGKTTFIKMLLGLHSIDGGELKLFGRAIRNTDDRQALKASIGYVSQHFALYNDMTIRENLLYFAAMRQIPIDTALKRISRYASELGFSNYLDSVPTELPLGINQRFSLAAALLHEPAVLFLDEPTSGVDAIARSQFWELLSALKEKWGIAILITTHYMSEAEFCDRVVLLREGGKVADDTVANLYALHPDARTFEDIFREYYR
ncbi:MAG: ATP-binding cassette domain-containing protein [Sulfuricurvum sp.]|jgi:ribosome-dependent ATPase|uniref:ATP-binding cassette domain-containing protein n=1 Tax=Sulfuricurvum sp. TaxID=2025608 RepID=UPI0025FA764B|nr:ATP-binding cassette domain-containing protein [Sulfuricurvum sp.]MCK9373263.1 ATP-binding cassette domain-containing protein [Sulfuricurvum sp.]